MAFRRGISVLSCALQPRIFGPRKNLSNLVALTLKLSLGFSVLRAATSFVSPLNKMSTFSYINADLAKNIDAKLMEQPGFTIDQLMELAGYSVATATHDYLQTLASINADTRRGILIFCGPGNNGGDGLVAARHLKHFGYDPTVVYVKPGRATIFSNLVKQCHDLSIPVLPSFEKDAVIGSMDKHSVIVDALFGFSFDGAPREPFASMIQYFKETNVPVVSVDIPSGWDVDKGDVHGTGFIPECVVSLTLPKLCMKDYSGVHYIGGRFVPEKLAQEMQITLPDYGFGPNQIVKVSEGRQCSAKDDQVSVMFATAASMEEARAIGQALLARKLIACVNMVPKISSMYEWEGKLEESQEVLMMIKTTSAQIDAVTVVIKSLHSYTVPESIALSVVGGNKEYLDWVRKSVTSD